MDTQENATDNSGDMETADDYEGMYETEEETQDDYPMVDDFLPLDESDATEPVASTSSKSTTSTGLALPPSVNSIKDWEPVMEKLMNESYHSSQKSGIPGKPSPSSVPGQTLATPTQNHRSNADKDWSLCKHTPSSLSRITSDLRSLYNDPLPGILVHVFESNVSKMMTLMTGPHGTPYEGGFFQFILQCPPDYPMSSPRVQFLTTAGGTVRFNPNLYANGKVCLSLIGTWQGPPWSPALTLSTLLLSIQSLMGEFPYQNEPAYEKTPVTSKAVLDYNANIRHETIRVAVISMVEDALSVISPYPAATKPVPIRPTGRGHYWYSEESTTLTEDFAKMILTGFLSNFQKYVKVCEDNTSTHGSTRVDALGYSGQHGIFKWKDLVSTLAKLKIQVEALPGMGNDAAGSCKKGEE